MVLLQYLHQMLSPLNVVLAVVCVDADMTHFLVQFVEIVSFAHIEVVLVIVFNVWVGVVLEALGQCLDDILLLVFVFIIGVHEHVLVVISHIEVLLYCLRFFRILILQYLDFFLLDCELCIKMLEERTVFIVLIKMHFIG